MKTLLLRVCIWMGLITLTVGAATITINIPTADVPRIATAYGKAFNLGRDATITEVQEALRMEIIATVLTQEGKSYFLAYIPTPLQMMPTPTPTPTATPTSTP